jgi:hypothetical protein
VLPCFGINGSAMLLRRVSFAAICSLASLAPAFGSDDLYTINESGWSPPELKTLGRLPRHWVTEFSVGEDSQKVWELPMIELHPEPGS